MARVYTPDSKAFAPPSVTVKPSDITPSFILRELTGMYADWPRSKRQVNVAPGKNGMRAPGKEWSSADMSELMFRSDRFALFVMLVIVHTNDVLDAARANEKAFTKADVKALQSGEYDGKLAVRAFTEWAAQKVDKPGEGVNRNGAATVLTAVARVLEDMAIMCSDARVHPLDVVDFAYRSTLNNIVAARYGRGANASEKEFSRITKEGIDALQTGEGVQILRAMGRARRHFDGSKLAVLNSMGRALRLYEGQLFRGFYSKAGLKPWAPPAASKLKKSGATGFESLLSGAEQPGVVGVEIRAITYRIPVAFDEEGVPTQWASVRHETSAESARKIAKSAGDNDADEFRAAWSYLMDLSPAGRLYLCYDIAGQHCFLATDNAPRRRLFLVSDVSEKDAALNRIQPLNSPLTGFVI